MTKIYTSTLINATRRAKSMFSVHSWNTSHILGREKGCVSKKLPAGILIYLVELIKVGTITISFPNNPD